MNDELIQSVRVVLLWLDDPDCPLPTPEQRREVSNLLRFFCDLPKQATSRPTTPEQLRTYIEDEIDSVENQPILSRFISQDARDVLNAMKGHFQDSTATELQDILNRMPARP